MTRAVFLDRDGVLNRARILNGKPYPPRSLDELEIPPGAAPALERLKSAGFLLIVVTNQPDLARGSLTPSVLEAIHDALRACLPIDDILVCVHDDGHHCDCRKPKPGLLTAAAQRYRLALTRCYLIGDRWRDIGAGHAAGCRTVWIDCHYLEPGPSQPPHARARSLDEAVDWILQDCGS